jgi:hypothetical protein
MLDEFKIIKCKPLADYQIEVVFADGLKGTVDLKHLVGKGVFKIWNNYKEFQKAKVNPITKTIEWPGEIDLDSFKIRQQLNKKLTFTKKSQIN